MTVKCFRKLLNKHKTSYPLSVICTKNMQTRFLTELSKHPGKSVIFAQSKSQLLSYEQHFLLQSLLEYEPDFADEYIDFNY